MTSPDGASFGREDTESGLSDLILWCAIGIGENGGEVR